MTPSWRQQRDVWLINRWLASGGDDHRGSQDLPPVLVRLDPTGPGRRAAGRPVARWTVRGWRLLPAALAILFACVALTAACTTVAGHPVPAGSSAGRSAGQPATAPRPKDRD